LRCWRGARRPRTRSCWCCGTRSRCSADRWPDLGLTGPTARCWPAFAAPATLGLAGTVGAAGHAAAMASRPGAAPLGLPSPAWPSHRSGGGPVSGAADGQREPDLGLSPRPRRAVPSRRQDRASTVWSILQRAGVDAAPQRTAVSRRLFLRAQAKGVLAVDLLHRGHGVPQAPVRAVCDRGRNPPGARAGGDGAAIGGVAAQQARNLLMALDDRNGHRPHRALGQAPPLGSGEHLPSCRLGVSCDEIALVG
jgi:hypothetical protein